MTRWHPGATIDPPETPFDEISGSYWVNGTCIKKATEENAKSGGGAWCTFTKKINVSKSN